MSELALTLIFALPKRELSSAGSEHLPYKQRVGGSNPSAPTEKRLKRNLRPFFYALCLPPHFLCYQAFVNILGDQVIQIVTVRMRILSFMRCMLRGIIIFLFQRIQPPKRGLKFVIRFIEFFKLKNVRFKKRVRGGVWMELGLEDHIERNLAWYGEYEWAEYLALCQFLVEGKVFLDIGSNIGTHALLIANQFPESCVYAFEPSPFIFNRLARNSSLNHFRNVQIHPIGIGSEDGRIPLFISDASNLGMSSFRVPENGTGEKIEVQCLQLDSWVRDSKIAQIELVKIDVEGAEWQVLQGMQAVIRAFLPVIALEVRSSLLSRFDKSPADLYELLQRFDYVPFSVLANGELIPASWGQEADLIFFVNSKSLQKFRLI